MDAQVDNPAIPQYPTHFGKYFLNLIAVVQYVVANVQIKLAVSKRQFFCFGCLVVYASISLMLKVGTRRVKNLHRTYAMPIF